MTSIIDEALAEITEMSPQDTDGKWLENLTARCASFIAEWDVVEAWGWKNWPDKERYYPKTPDIGIDVVAQRKSDGKFIAIQCKSRKLDEGGHGDNIDKVEFDSFLAASARSLWVERWLVVNGDVDLGANARKTLGIDPSKPVKPVNIESDLLKQKLVDGQVMLNQSCPHCTDTDKPQTRDCMQREAIEHSTSILLKHEEITEGGVRQEVALFFHVVQENPALLYVSLRDLLSRVRYQWFSAHP